MTREYRPLVYINNIILAQMSGEGLTKGQQFRGQCDGKSVFFEGRVGM